MSIGCALRPDNLVGLNLIETTSLVIWEIHANAISIRATHRRDEILRTRRIAHYA
jgi:hypothetical protein